MATAVAQFIVSVSLEDTNYHKRCHSIIILKAITERQSPAMNAPFNFQFNYKVNSNHTPFTIKEQNQRQSGERIVRLECSVRIDFSSQNSCARKDCRPLQHQLSYFDNRTADKENR